ncbi:MULTISPECIES: threo-3-hydroxy-L-aspartate ammonia-lyase [Variovorax]|uniref:threo-3-hydroxy-L-aspartate ammonia-lyase n=1 Tax=Variovorax TaxID=34072 RepID=UPI00086ACF4A|nr:MAG: serine dehydratase [Lautropia sp. SCN 69-89]ODV17317.1 MAG: serine dehydratase [Variovorax sp. SCN 67-20]OJZ04499.1 MAG: serine dehydratase [Variovorax sp. 67-131]
MIAQDIGTPATAEDVLVAARALQGVAHRTPVMQSHTLNERLGAEIFFKCENLQRMGAFKFRGAFNAVAQLDPERRAAGVITYSSGNHAQATALAARLLGTRATILMPGDTPTVKRDSTRGYGAEVVLYDRLGDDREAMCATLVKARGLTLIHPFDDNRVIAGQGTAALELIQEVGELDSLLTPLGGGGLLAGSALAAHLLSPRCQVVGVEPTASDDGQQSLRAGRIVRISPPQSIAEGALGTQLGERNFEIIRHHVHDVVTVEDASIVHAMQWLAQRMKMVVEPTGALGLGALLEHVLPVHRKRVGVILSGGNVDLRRYAALLAGAPTAID